MCVICADVVTLNNKVSESEPRRNPSLNTGLEWSADHCATSLRKMCARAEKKVLVKYYSDLWCTSETFSVDLCSVAEIQNRVL